MRALQAVFERRQDQPRLQEFFAKLVVLVEEMAVERRVALGIDPGVLVEGVLRLLDLLAQPHVAVFLAAAPLHVEDVVHLLQEHRDSFHAVGDLAGDRRQVDAADLLEVGELRDLGAVQHDLPADAPGAERRRLPVVFLESDVVLPRVDADGFETVEIDLLHFVRRRLEDHLQLVMLEQAIRILPEAAVVRAACRLDVRHVPRRRARARATMFPDARCRPRPRDRAAAESGSLATAQNCCSLRIRSWNVTSRTPQLVQHANGPWLPFEVHRYQLPMNELNLPQHAAARAE